MIAETRPSVLFTWTCFWKKPNCVQLVFSLNGRILCVSISKIWQKSTFILSKNRLVHTNLNYTQIKLCERVRFVRFGNNGITYGKDLFVGFWWRSSNCFVDNNQITIGNFQASSQSLNSSLLDGSGASHSRMFNSLTDGMHSSFA